MGLLGLNAGGRTLPRPSGRGPVELQLGVNDFHADLEPPSLGIGGRPVEPTDKAARSHPDRTIRVHAGDMIGASPLISSYFHDEPTIEATNMMGFDVGASATTSSTRAARCCALWARAAVARREHRRPETGATLLPPYKVIGSRRARRLHRRHDR